MSLASMIEKRVERGGIPVRCGVALVVEKLSKADVVALHAAIADHTITATAIADGVKGVGQYLSDQSIARHRRGRCRCA